MIVEEMEVRLGVVKEAKRRLREAEWVWSETHKDKGSSEGQCALADSYLESCRGDLAATWAAMLPGEEVTA